MPEMGRSNSLDIIEGGVCDVDELFINKVVEEILISLSPLLYTRSCCGWHLAEMVVAKSRLVVVCTV
jgi:hypothetical protein